MYSPSNVKSGILAPNSCGIPSRPSLLRLPALIAIWFFAASSALALPTVSGNFIGWPDDGWYQVQDAETYAEVCAGGRQCEVVPGTYIVVNHSSGTRWDSVIVEAEAHDSTAASRPITSVVVDGTTIRWPDDGWYQVQSASNYQTVCEGGSACEVEAGSYTVINHSTGQRFENIVVGLSAIEDLGTHEAEAGNSPDVNTRTSSWSIDSNTIRFHTEGWFQVQSEGRSLGYPTVCQGEATCQVEDGFYQILNHTTGEIWQRVKVGDSRLRWSQSNLFDAALSWSSVVYNYEPFNRFAVYMNGELVATTTTSNAIVSGFVRGTNYRVSVYALLADGSEELIGETDILTIGPSTEIVPYGRPTEDRNTFGFEVWDDIPEEQLLNFPSDCLFAIPSGGFCFSPGTRYLIGYGGESINWEFPLPGDNRTNNIEALVHFYGTGGRRSPAKRIALVTDVTSRFTESKYEISVFRGTFGTFLGTYPILDNILRSDSSGLATRINLDGSDLRVSLGPVRPPENMFGFPLPRRLQIAGEYYKPSGTGNLADLSGWTRSGAFVSIVDGDTGEALSQSFYPGQRVEEVFVE